MLRSRTNVKIDNLVKVNNLCQQVKQRERLIRRRFTFKIGIGPKQFKTQDTMNYYKSEI